MFKPYSELPSAAQIVVQRLYPRPPGAPKLSNMEFRVVDETIVLPVQGRPIWGLLSRDPPPTREKGSLSGWKPMFSPFHLSRD
jgi:hypothetical protein